MANIKITELPEELNPQGSEYLVIDDGTTTKKVKMENITAGGVPAGGTIGQTIIKQSSEDGDAIWGGQAIDYTETGESGKVIQNAQLFDGKEPDDFVMNNYALVTINTDDWTEDTLGTELCYSCTKTVLGAVAGKHPITSCLPTSIATMDDENDAFGLIVKFVDGTDSIKIYARELPTVDFQVQVVNF